MKFQTVIMLLTVSGIFACNSSENRKAGTADIENNGASPENPNGNKKGAPGTPQFEQTIHDFGRINDGEEVQHKFKFKNTGKGDLTINTVQASCGCTTPEWTKEVVPAGGEGYVTATFNSNGKGGPDGPRVEKSITVTFVNSTIEQIELKFVSNIWSKETEKK